MENRPDDSGYEQISRNDRDFRAPSDTRRQRKILFIAIVCILLAVALFVGSFRLGNKYSDKTLSTIWDSIVQLGKRQQELERMENRIALLEKLQKGLSQHVSKLDRSAKSTRGQLNKLSQEIALLQQRIGPDAAKEGATRGIREKPPSGGKGHYYEVCPGDSLYTISRKYSVSVDELCRFNHITPDQVILPGQKIIISRDSPQ